MSVAVGYLGTEAARRALDVAAREAVQRKTSLLVIHVVEMLDESVANDHRTSVSEEVTAFLESAGLSDLDWDVHVSTEDRAVAEAILDAAVELGAELLVVGSRSRSSLGKVLFGSVSQTIARNSQTATIEVTVVDSPSRE